MTFEPGAQLDNHQLVSLIGRGGMGEVWLARDTRLGRTVALKLLPPDLTTDERRRARFQREARAASGLNHPNICTIYSLGDAAADGWLYLTMEYVSGDTPRQRLSQHGVTLVDAVAIATAIGSALSARAARRAEWDGRGRCDVSREADAHAADARARTADRRDVVA